MAEAFLGTSEGGALLLDGAVARVLMGRLVAHHPKHNDSSSARTSLATDRCLARCGMKSWLFSALLSVFPCSYR